MKKIKRAIGVFILVCLAASLLAACGGKKEEKPETTKAEETTKEELVINTTEEETTEEETEEILEETKENIEQGLDAEALATEKDFYSSAVFIGDSVGYGFELYNDGNPDKFPGMQFLCSGSFGAYHAINDIPGSEGSYQPTCYGVEDYVWNSVGKMGVDKAIVFLGINDFNMGELDATYEWLTTVMDNIKSCNPGVEVYFLSITPLLYGTDSGQLSNVNIVDMNERISKFCQEKDYGFINVHPYLLDDLGGLEASYCSDGFVHETWEAYDVWTNVLLDYAKNHR